MRVTVANVAPRDNRGIVSSSLSLRVRGDGGGVVVASEGASWRCTRASHREMERSSEIVIRRFLPMRMVRGMVVVVVVVPEVEVC